MNFEDNLKALEGLVARMESGELSLDETMKAFEQGRTLLDTCTRELEGIRQRIEKVTANGPAPFAISKEAQA